MIYKSFSHSTIHLNIGALFMYEEEYKELKSYKDRVEKLRRYL